MATIHRTTLTPTKLELLTDWLPGQPWYADRGRAPELAKAGGFRLDDPQGEVGIEFMVVTDGSDDQAVSYLMPMTYRASALAGADGALIGTTEHGVLGRRWIYDGIGDPVLVGQLVALIQGQAQPQMQSVSDTPRPDGDLRAGGRGPRWRSNRRSRATGLWAPSCGLGRLAGDGPGHHGQPAAPARRRRSRPRPGWRCRSGTSFRSVAAARRNACPRLPRRRAVYACLIRRVMEGAGGAAVRSR